MKLIIAGSRTLTPSFEFILNSIRMLKINNIEEIVSGVCEGVDLEGEHFASHMNLKIVQFPANWKKYGNTAGPIRNKEMAKYANCLLLIWDGESKGSSNMKKEMEKLNKPIYEVIIR